jgi:uncharacterized MAPEG superfamily protein
MASLNYHLLAIPAYYIFSILPHGYAASILTSSGYKINNTNPKASTSPDKIKGKVPDAVYVQFAVHESMMYSNETDSFKKYQRAENAHSNSTEQMPLFAAAVIASIIAERTTATGVAREAINRDATGLTTFIGAWFVVRSLYVASYVTIEDHTKSFIRSSFWAIGSGLAFYQIYKAAALLG